MTAPVSTEHAPLASVAPIDRAAERILAAAPGVSNDTEPGTGDGTAGVSAPWVRPANRLNRYRHLVPGLWLALVVSLAATFAAEHGGGSQVLYALLFGMAFRLFDLQPAGTEAGIEFASRALLRFAVALLGAHITFAQIERLGWWPLVIVGLATPTTILFGLGCTRLLGRRYEEGFLSSRSVGICGSSAAMAIVSVLPPTRDNEQHATLTIIGVTGLSTLVMMLYPMLAGWLGLDAKQAGIFMGATIHNIPQAVAAGYVMSPEAGDIATYVKLVRITLLVPMILLCSLIYRSRRHDAQEGRKASVLPPFMYGFAALVVLNSAGVIPETVGGVLNDVSRWCMAISIAAVGVKTCPRQLIGVGWRPVIMLVLNTIFLAALVLALLWLEKSS